MDVIVGLLSFIAVVSFFFTAHRICLIYDMFKVFSETHISSQAAILKSQTELLKETRVQNRLSAQLLKAYGHEPDYGPVE